MSSPHFTIMFYKHFFLIAVWVVLNAPSYPATVTPIKLIDFDHLGIILNTEYFLLLSINSLLKYFNPYLKWKKSLFRMRLVSNCAVWTKPPHFAVYVQNNTSKCSYSNLGNYDFMFVKKLNRLRTLYSMKMPMAQLTHLVLTPWKYLLQRCPA